MLCQESTSQSRAWVGLSGRHDRPAAVVIHCRYGIGDVAMSLSALRALRREAGDAAVYWVAARPANELLELVRRPGDRLVLHSDLGLRHWGDDGNLRIQAAIDGFLNDLPDATLHVGVLHSPKALRTRVIFGSHEWRHEDTQVQNAAGVAGLGPEESVVRAAEAGWEVRVKPEDRRPVSVPARWSAQAAQWMAERNLLGRAPIVAAVTGSSPLKVWPTRRLAQICDLVARRYDRDVLIVAGPDRTRARAVVGAMRYAYRARVVGTMHLMKLCGLLERCHAVVSNDTGLLQLSALVGTPHVGIFGPTRAGFYAPTSGISLPVEPGGVACSLRRPDEYGPPACLVDHRCRLPMRSCIDQVGLHAVARALRHLLAETRQHRSAHAPSV